MQGTSVPQPRPSKVLTPVPLKMENTIPKSERTNMIQLKMLAIEYITADAFPILYFSFKQNKYSTFN